MNVFQLTRATSDTALTLSVSFLWSNLTFRKLEKKNSKKIFKHKTSGFTYELLEEIFVDVYALVMYSHVLLI